MSLAKKSGPKPESEADRIRARNADLVAQVAWLKAEYEVMRRTAADAAAVAEKCKALEAENVKLRGMLAGHVTRIGAMRAAWRSDNQEMSDWVESFDAYLGRRKKEAARLFKEIDEKPKP